MIRQRPLWISPGDPSLEFPDVKLALREPDGLLAVGGDLTAERILSAYRRGIFPWYSDDQPILWWSPDPRTLLFPERLHVSRSLRKSLRRQTCHVTFDTAFEEVIRHCAVTPRTGQDGTWITPRMIEAYKALHREGHAHSVEVWRGTELVGGLYGVAVGAAFYGESMFSRIPDASKIVMVYLAELLDEILDEPEEALTHYKEYLDLDAESAWAAEARAHLGQLP